MRRQFFPFQPSQPTPQKFLIEVNQLNWKNSSVDTTTGRGPNEIIYRTKNKEPREETSQLIGLRNAKLRNHYIT